jgi:hypothetical protein
MTLKDDYMSCKDYNLMKSLSKCLYTMNFHQNEFCAILICFIGHKMYSEEGQFDVYKVLNFLMSFILCKTKLLILKNCGWPYIDDYGGMVSLKVWIYVLF